MNIAVLGAGQLADMMAEAGKKLDINLHCLSPDAEPCAKRAASITNANYDDAAAIDAIMSNCELLTYEHEKLPLDALQKYQASGLLRPPLKALAFTQDRLEEKRFLQSHGIETAPFANVESASDCEKAGAITGMPAILKTRFDGYDGKGQVRINNAEDVQQAWQSLGKAPCILEGFVTFNRELSIIAARGVAGDVVFYPVTENDHHDGILQVSTVRPTDAMQPKAEALMQRLMDDMGYVGVMTTELFESNGELIANEIAPRVHNSGHWTIEGADRSQFENHLRAVAGQALEAPKLTHPTAVMVNLIGELPDLSALQTLANVTVHLYGKTARPGRKLGHITIVGGANQNAFNQQVEAVLALVEKR